jgi:acyl dehydratase
VITVDELADVVGRALGPTGWHRVGDEEVARFGAAVGGPPPAWPTVPPFLLLSLTNRFLPELLAVGGTTSGVNYGTGVVRFGEPVRIGARLRAGGRVVDVVEVTGGVQATVRVTHEVEGRETPACVVDTISRYLR